MKFEIGRNNEFEIRYECCTLNVQESIRIAFLSDFHFNKKSQSIIEKILDTLHKLSPDLILFGGDYVDSRRGFDIFYHFLDSFDYAERTFAIAGNHDYFFGIDRVKNLMGMNNIKWIEKQSVLFQSKGTNIQIDGNCSRNKNRNADIHINLIHNPSKIINGKYDIVLAGHLHGSQIVLWRKGDIMYPGKLFYKWNLLRKKLENSWIYISKGLGDTLPIRISCRKEIVIIDVLDKSNPESNYK